ncbi:hypothetical protein BHE74_00028295 [Ensete ventricosum]|nr:hypothetical protein GW17_00052869 [Ensete ventricosum]RWW64466.1 hypothetical protein BHE74_00028295 [Ensete ventricosum]
MVDLVALFISSSEEHSYSGFYRTGCVMMEAKYPSTPARSSTSHRSTWFLTSSVSLTESAGTELFTIRDVHSIRKLQPQ